jgi:hypothetical protein
VSYLQGKWDQWKLGIEYSLGTIDNTGLMDVTTSQDWLRFGMGGHNIEVRFVPRHDREIVSASLD